MHCDWGMMRDETNWDKTEGVAELRGRLDRIREGFEAAIEAPERPDELADIVAHAETLDAAHQSVRSSAEEAFERGGGGWGGGQFAPPHDERFADLLNYIKRRSLSRASAAQKADRETDFARIDEAIATHRKP